MIEERGKFTTVKLFLIPKTCSFLIQGKSVGTLGVKRETNTLNPFFLSTVNSSSVGYGPKYIELLNFVIFPLSNLLGRAEIAEVLEDGDIFFVKLFEILLFAAENVVGGAVLCLGGNNSCKLEIFASWYENLANIGVFSEISGDDNTPKMIKLNTITYTQCGFTFGILIII